MVAVGITTVEVWVVVDTSVSKVVNDRSSSVLEVSRRVVVKVEKAVTVNVLADNVLEMVEVA